MTEIKATTRKERQEKRFISKETQTSAKYLHRLEELPEAPQGIEPFYQTLRHIYAGWDTSKQNWIRKP